MKTLMRFLMVLTISAGLSGCITRPAAVVGGADDLIVVPKGSIIQGVKLPTDEDKTYNIKTPKAGYWISMQGWNRVEKVTMGSNPEEDK